MMRIPSLVERAQRLPSRVVDASLAAFLALTGFADLATRTWTFEGLRPVDGLAYALVLLTTVPLVLRRERPVPVMAVVGASGVVGPVLAVPMTTPGVFGIMVAVYTVAAHGTQQESRATAIITAIALVIVAASFWGVISFAEIVSNYLLFGTAWILGDSLRHRRAYTAELEARTTALERERAERDVRAVEEERTRIARELHDVIAHTVSVMVVQAGAARRVAEQRPEEVRDAVGVIETTGRQALGELRRLLGVLRRGDEVSRALSPQPTLRGLEQLVAQVRDAGLPVELVVEGAPPELPPGVDLSAYRIVQEALTNVLKHAGPARAEVRVLYGTDAMVVEVADDGRGAGADAPSGSGHGLIGMRERAALYGGTLEFGARSGGGFRVRAHLPLVSSPQPQPAG